MKSLTETQMEQAAHKLCEILCIDPHGRRRLPGQEVLIGGQARTESNLDWAKRKVVFHAQVQSAIEESEEAK